MELKVKWMNATRLGDERARVEEEYASFIVDHFGSASEAFESKESFYRQMEPPTHPWRIAMVKAHHMATRSLLPSEARMAAFRLNFMGD